jgi:hypothetical protein
MIPNKKGSKNYESKGQLGEQGKAFLGDYFTSKALICVCVCVFFFFLYQLLNG